MRSGVRTVAEATILFPTDGSDRPDDARIGVTEASAVSAAPPRATVAYAADQGPDPVAMGTHGTTGLTRLCLGSATGKLVCLAEQPVLSVAPPDST